MLKILLYHMSKWKDGRDEALPLKTNILRVLEALSLSGKPLFEAVYIFDATRLVLQTVS